MRTPRLTAFLPSRNPATRAVLRCLIGCAVTAAFNDRPAPILPASPSPSPSGCG